MSLNFKHFFEMPAKRLSLRYPVSTLLFGYLDHFPADAGFEANKFRMDADFLFLCPGGAVSMN